MLTCTRPDIRADSILVLESIPSCKTHKTTTQKTRENASPTKTLPASLRGNAFNKNRKRKMSKIGRSKRLSDAARYHSTATAADKHADAIPKCGYTIHARPILEPRTTIFNHCQEKDICLLESVRDSLTRKSFMRCQGIDVHVSGWKHI